MSALVCDLSYACILLCVSALLRVRPLVRNRFRACPHSYVSVLVRVRSSTCAPSHMYPSSVHSRMSCFRTCLFRYVSHKCPFSYVNIILRVCLRTCSRTFILSYVSVLLFFTCLVRCRTWLLSCVFIYRVCWLEPTRLMLHRLFSFIVS